MHLYVDDIPLLGWGQIALCLNCAKNSDIHHKKSFAFNMLNAGNFIEKFWIEFCIEIKQLRNAADTETQTIPCIK